MDEQDKLLVENLVAIIRETVIPSKVNYAGTELMVRCPFCGDSHHKFSTHFYVSLDEKMEYNCKLCGAKGQFTTKTLNALQVYDADAIATLKTIRKNARSNNPQYDLKHRQKYIRVLHNEFTEKGLAYFNNRFGSNYTEEEVVEQFKCILDPFTFFDQNYITPRAMKYKDGNGELKFFDYDLCIGFVSTDGANGIFRDISGTQDRRYDNVPFDAKTKTCPTSLAYNIAAEIDILETKLTLIVCEGAFDCIGVKTHYGHEYEHLKNVVYTAACGKSFETVLNYYTRMGFLDIDLIIYSDADVPKSFYTEIKRKSPYINGPITVYYNDATYTDENGKVKPHKDFGNRIENIERRKVTI